MAWTAPRTWTDGELVTKAIMDVHVRDNLNAVGPIQKVRKAADETVTSNGTPQNDDHLLFSVAANEVWAITMRLSYTNNNVANSTLHIDHTIPAGASGFYTWRAQTAENEDLAWTTAQTGVGITSALDQPVWIDGTLINAGTAGTFQFQWAQTASSVTATTIRAGSWLWAVRLSP